MSDHFRKLWIKRLNHIFVLSTTCQKINTATNTAIITQGTKSILHVYIKLYFRSSSFFHLTVQIINCEFLNGYLINLKCKVCFVPKAMFFVVFVNLSSHSFKCDALTDLVPIVQLKNCENAHEGVYFSTKSNTPPWVFFTFFFLSFQMVPNHGKHFKYCLY